MSMELHAALGFLQAIHHSARVAKRNSKCCRLLSRAVGKIRPVLEELDMAAADGTAQPSLESLSFALENVHMMIVRFSAMGELQAVLESEAMQCKFAEACQEVANTLQRLLEDNIKCLDGMEDDISRIREELLDFNISSSVVNRKLAKDVRSTALQILEGKCNRSDGHMKIRNMLYNICRYARDNLQQELQGLERERSRAQAERDENEMGILTEVIKALERKTTSAPAAPCQPQPPVEYLCPISHMIMSDPVILVQTGQTYDRTSIEEWFNRGNNTCPITKQVVQQFQLTPNYALKSLASTWIDVHGGEPQETEWFGIRGPIVGTSRDTNKGMDIKGPQISDFCGDKGDLNGRVDLGAFPVMHVQTKLNSLIPNMIFDKFGLLRKGGGSFDIAKGKLAASTEVVVPKDSVAPDKAHQNDGVEEKRAEKPAEKRAPIASFALQNSALDTLKNVLSRRAHSLELPPSARVGVKMGDLDSPMKSEQLAAASGDNRRHSDPAGLSSKRSAMDVGPKGAQMWRSSSPQAELARLLQTRSTSLSRIPMSRQGGVKVLFDAISSSRRSLDKHRAPNPGGEDARKQSAEYSSSGGEKHSVDALPVFQVKGVQKFGTPAKQDFWIQGTEGTFSAFSVPSHPCSISCESDSCDEDESQAGDGHNETKEKITPVWYNSPGFDAESMTSLSTIAPQGFSVAKPPMKTFESHSLLTPFSGQLPSAGAVNILFDDAKSDCTELEVMEVSTPVLLEMIKSDDIDVAAASANELAIRAIKDSAVQADLECSGVLEKLVEMLQAEASDVKVAAARTLGTLGEKSVSVRAKIVEAGASQSLKDLTSAGGSVRCMDVANWALNRLSKSNSGNVPQSAASVEVSTPMLVQMMLSGDTDVQASAALDLEDRLLKNSNGFEELSKPDAVWRFVDLLEHERPDVQTAAATVLSLLVFRSQEVHHQVATRAGTVARLVRLVREANETCAAAAAQVLRTLAHGNSDVRDEIMNRGIVHALEELLTCLTPTSGVREVSAWLLGILGSHTEESQQEIQSSQAVYHLQHLLEVGQPHEVVAASWALQAIVSSPGEATSSQVSIPIVIETLESGKDNIKVGSVFELCHLASEGFWLQMEIVECGGLRSLLKFLRGTPCSDGSHAALVTLHKIVKDVPSTPVTICQEGGVSVLVKLLKAVDNIERQLAMEILLVLAERCPLHQPEVVTEGAVPLFTKLLVDKEQSVCSAAFDILLKLASSEMSVVATSMASLSTPDLLKILVEDNLVHSKEAAARLIEAISGTIEGQQVLVDHGALKLLMKVMENGESFLIKKVAGNVVATLAKKDTKACVNLAGAGAFGALVQLLQSGSTRRRSLEPQDVENKSFPTNGIQRSAKTCSQLPSIVELGSTPTPKQALQMLTARLASQTHLPAVPESTAEGSESGEDHVEVGLKCHPCSIHDTESTSGSCIASGDSAAECASNTTGTGEKVQGLVEILRQGDNLGKEAAAFELRNLAQGDKISRLELVRSGAVPLLVDLLQSKSLK